MSENKQSEMLEVNSFDEIPIFKNESDEAEFWANHCLSDELLEQMKPIDEGILPPHRKVGMKGNL
jgi:hypothetical protein